MKCPKCNSDIKAIAKQCSACSHPFDSQFYDKLEYYFDLKHEFQYFDGLKKTIQNRLEFIENKMNKYESVFNYTKVVEGQNVSVKQPYADKTVEQKVVPEVTNINNAQVSKITEEEKIVAAEIKTGQTEPKPKKSSDSNLEVKFGQKWLLVIGIIVIVFGVGYFLKYSFDKGWIGPAARVIMAYVFGIVFLIGGNQFRKKSYEIFGLNIIGGGIAVLYFSTFAAFQIYHLILQIPALALMIITTALTCFLSVIYNSKWLSVLAILGGFLTPVLLSTGVDNQIGLMSYVSILNLGILGVAFYKRWNLLNVLGFIATYIIYIGWFAKYYDITKFWGAIIFINIFYLMYTLIPFAYKYFRESKLNGFDLNIITINSFISFGFSYYMIDQFISAQWVSIITVFYAVIFLFIASFIYSRIKKIDNTLFIVLLSDAMLYLIITVPILFSKQWITIFWAAQILSVTWMGIKMRKSWIMVGTYILMAITVGKFLFYDYFEIFNFRNYCFCFRDVYNYLIIQRLITTVLLLVVFYLSARLLKKFVQNLNNGEPISFVFKGSTIVSILFWTLLFITLNIESAGFFNDYLPNAKLASISVLWSLFAATLLVKGIINRNLKLRILSLILFAATIIKVFAFDMEQFSTPYRIISFMILGSILVVASYLYHRYNDKIMNALGSFNQDNREK